VVGFLLSVARRHRPQVGSPQSLMMVTACNTTSRLVITPLIAASGLGFTW
jgi:hypothetical protein